MIKRIISLLLAVILMSAVFTSVSATEAENQTQKLIEITDNCVLYYVPTDVDDRAGFDFTATVQYADLSCVQYDFIKTDETYSAEAVYKTTVSVSEDYTETEILNIKYQVWGLVNYNKEIISEKEIDVYSCLSDAHGKVFIASTETVEDYKADNPKLKIKKINLSAGKTTKATIEGAGKAPVEFSSSKPNVAIIDRNGKITAKSKGKTKITAIVANRKITKTIKVKTTPVLKFGKKVVKNNQVFKIKRKQLLTLKISGKCASIKNFIVNGNNRIVAIKSKINEDKLEIKGKRLGIVYVSIMINQVKTYQLKIKVVE